MRSSGDRVGKTLMARRGRPLTSPAVVADNDRRLERRVARAAEEALAEHKFVSPIDVLCGLGWLHPSNVERWRRGRPACLEDVVFIDPTRIVTAIGLLQKWASERGLEPSERPYPAGSRTQRELRFSAAGEAELERAYKTHWLSPDFNEAERSRLTEREARRPDLVVIEPLKDFTCSVCGVERTGLLIVEDPGPVCMVCADLRQTGHQRPLASDSGFGRTAATSSSALAARPIACKFGSKHLMRGSGDKHVAGDGQTDTCLRARAGIRCSPRWRGRLCPKPAV